MQRCIQCIFYAYYLLFAANANFRTGKMFADSSSLIKTVAYQRSFNTLSHFRVTDLFITNHSQCAMYLTFSLFFVYVTILESCLFYDLNDKFRTFKWHRQYSPGIAQSTWVRDSLELVDGGSGANYYYYFRNVPNLIRCMKVSPQWQTICVSTSGASLATGSILHQLANPLTMMEKASYNSIRNLWPSCHNICTDQYKVRRRHDKTKL